VCACVRFGGKKGSWILARVGRPKVGNKTLAKSRHALKRMTNNMEKQEKREKCVEKLECWLGRTFTFL